MIDGRIGDDLTRTLMGLVAVYETEGRATVRRVAAVTGRSLSVTWGRLMRLRDLGLAAGIGEGQRKGALRPLVHTAERVSARRPGRARAA